jgi:hypothetical protein
MYIIIIGSGTRSVVATAKGIPRDFPKAKKAKNFLQGRPRLRDLEYKLTDDISDIPNRMRVDL